MSDDRCGEKQRSLRWNVYVHDDGTLNKRMKFCMENYDGILLAKIVSYLETFCVSYYVN
jgi:hypothetical protein